jgi:PAS domain S-box-containing protein
MSSSSRTFYQAEAHLQIIADSIPAMIWISGTDRPFYFFNAYCLRFTGQTLQHESGYGWLTGMHPDDLQRFMDEYTLALQSRKDFRIEYRLKRNDGQYRWLRDHGVPSYDNDGNFTGHIGSRVDMDEILGAVADRPDHLADPNFGQQQELSEELSTMNEELASTNEELAATNEDLINTQEALKGRNEELTVSESRFRSLVQQAPVAIFILSDRQLTIEAINDRMLKMLGKTADVVGRTCRDILPEFEGQPFFKLMDDVFASGQPFFGNEISALVNHDGVLKEGFYNFTYQPIKNDEGITNGIICTAVEVTEQVNARKKAERAEESLRMAIDAAELGSYYINAADRIFVASPRLKEFFGYGPDEELPYEAAINQIHPDYRQAAADMVEASFTKG